MKEKRKKTFGLLGGVWVLGMASLISKLMGAFYRIPLTRALGSHGMGLYASVFPSYALIVTVTGGGLASAVSKLTAANGGKADVKSLCAAAALLSLPVTFAALMLARAISAAAGAPEACAALKILLPSVPLSCVCSVMRGYFLGKNELGASALSQLTEQSVKLVAGLSLSYWLSRFSLAAAVAGCAAGVSAGEAACLAYSYFAFRRSEKRKRVGDSEESAATVPEIAASQNAAANASVTAMTEASAELAVPVAAAAAVASKSRASAFAAFRTLALTLVRVSLPITLSLTVLPLCQVADSFVVVNMLASYGTAADTATKLYGLVTGPVNSLVNLPAVFTVGLCATLLPKISRLVERGEEIRSTVRRVLILSLGAGLVMGAGLCAVSRLSLKILYGGSLGFDLGFAAHVLCLASIAVPFMTVSQCVASVLQGAGRSYSAAVGLLAAAVIKEALNFVLLPLLGIVGFVIASAVFYIAACAANLFSLRRLLKSYAKLEN